MAFVFRASTGPIDWSIVQAAELDVCLRSTDTKAQVHVLQALLDGLTFSSVTPIELRQCTHECVCKLVRALQMMVEYLLCSQDAQLTALTHAQHSANKAKRKVKHLKASRDALKESLKWKEKEVGGLKAAFQSAQELLFELGYAPPSQAGHRYIPYPNIGMDPVEQAQAMSKVVHEVVSAVSHQHSEQLGVLREELEHMRGHYNSALSRTQIQPTKILSPVKQSSPKPHASRDRYEEIESRVSRKRGNLFLAFLIHKQHRAACRRQLRQSLLKWMSVCFHYAKSSSNLSTAIAVPPSVPQSVQIPLSMQLSALSPEQRAKQREIILRTVQARSYLKAQQRRQNQREVSVNTSDDFNLTPNPKPDSTIDPNPNPRLSLTGIAPRSFQPSLSDAFIPYDQDLGRPTSDPKPRRSFDHSIHEDPESVFESLKSKVSVDVRAVLLGPLVNGLGHSEMMTEADTRVQDRIQGQTYSKGVPEVVDQLYAEMLISITPTGTHVAAASNSPTRGNTYTAADEQLPSSTSFSQILDPRHSIESVSVSSISKVSENEGLPSVGPAPKLVKQLRY